MKFLSAILFIFFCNISFSQTIVNVKWVEKSSYNPRDIIYYGLNKKLTWSDFKAKPVASNPVAAITSSGFGYNADMKSKDGKGEINIEVYCYFNKLKSWGKTKSKTPYILEHEQHHFDATYLAAISFMKKVQTAKFSIENMDEVLGKLYKESFAAMNKMQNEYDTQTNHGINKTKQTEWNLFFDKELNP